MPKSATAGSHGKSTLHFQRKGQTALPSGCTILRPTSDERVIQFLPILASWVLSLFFILAIPLGVEWYLTQVLISISLIINEDEHLSIYL